MSSPPKTRNRSAPGEVRKLSLVAPWLLGLVPVVTGLVIWLGPEYGPVGADTPLSSGAATQAISEPTDRFVLALWLLGAVAFAVALALARLASAPVISTRRRAIAAWAVIPGIALVVAGLLYARDATGIAMQIRPLHLVLGGAIATGVVLATAFGARARKALNITMVAVALGLFLPLLIQFPDNLADLTHARVAFEDLFAVAAGAVPLHDFFPQYGLLLGYPVAALISVFPASAFAIATTWMVSLQAVTLGVAIAAVTWAGGRRVLGAAFIVVPSLVFAAGPPGLAPFSYFPVNPMRTVLPVVALAVAAIVLGTRRPTKGVVGYPAIGAIAGIAALNNPDFGIPAVIAVVGTAALVAGSERWWRAAVLAIGGVVAPFLAWTVATWIAGSPASWSDYLLFQRLFGTNGYLNAPMPAVGWQTGTVVLFMAAFVLGVLLVRRTRRQAGSRLARQGTLLTLVGGWSLLTLPYYAGRSMSPTLIGGYALQIGWTAACLIPLVVLALRSPRVRKRSQPSTTTGLSVAAGMLALTLAGVGIVNAVPADGWARPSGPSASPDADALPANLDAAPDEIKRAAEAGELVQMLGTPSLTALTTGVPRISAFGQPAEVQTAARLAELQCQILEESPAKYVILPSSIVPALATNPACQAPLDFSATVGFGIPTPPATEPPLTAIPLRGN